MEPCFITPFPRIDLQVAILGYRTVRLDDVSGDLEVTLTAGIPVRLLLPAGVPLPVRPYHVKAQLALRGVTDHGAVDHFGPAFDDRREITVIAPGPGEMEVVWFVETRRQNFTSPRPVPPKRKQYVEVLDVEGEQTFVLDISAEEMAEILAAGK